VNAAESITAMIANLSEGGAAARNRLVSVIYAELRRVAAVQLRLERPNHTLQPTALAHEACMRLLRSPGEWKDREHLFRTAAKVMRQILMDYARSRAAEKRGRNPVPVTLSKAAHLPASWSIFGFEDILALDGAIQKLKKMDERQSTIVELRFFVGLTEEEIAGALNVSIRTVKRDWESARAWLYSQLKKTQLGSR
jgi:RNA polymerase sigma-70 factor, ECF subfamily